MACYRDSFAFSYLWYDELEGTIRVLFLLIIVNVASKTQKKQNAIEPLARLKTSTPTTDSLYCT
jgi:hypothetical protein